MLQFRSINAGNTHLHFLLIHVKGAKENELGKPTLAKLGFGSDQ